MSIIDEFTTIRPKENSLIPDELKSESDEYLSKDCAWYSSQEDLEDLLFVLDMCLKNPKTKFSSRYHRIEKMRVQINGVLKRK